MLVLEKKITKIAIRMALEDGSRTYNLFSPPITEEVAMNKVNNAVGPVMETVTKGVIDNVKITQEWQSNSDAVGAGSIEDGRNLLLWIANPESEFQGEGVEFTLYGVQDACKDTSYNGIDESNTDIQGLVAVLQSNELYVGSNLRPITALLTA